MTWSNLTDEDKLSLYFIAGATGLGLVRLPLMATPAFFCQCRCSQVLAVASRVTSQGRRLEDGLKLFSQVSSEVVLLISPWAMLHTLLVSRETCLQRVRRSFRSQHES